MDTDTEKNSKFITSKNEKIEVNNENLFKEKIEEQLQQLENRLRKIESIKVFFFIIFKFFKIIKIF